MIHVPTDFTPGTLYTTNNYGQLAIVEYRHSASVSVKFLASGSEAVARAASIRRGKVKDLFRPNVYGVGYMGEGRNVSWLNGRETPEYSVWSKMIKRCYCPKSLVDHPTYLGCSVVTEWHNFNTFAEWFKLNYIEGFQLDKDIKVKGNRIYSPSTCAFVSRDDNVEAAQAKEYYFLTPVGKKIRVYNLTKFCAANSLHVSNMVQVYKGNRPHHKGWRKAQ